MLTWRLWHALCHPPYRHPLFTRIAAAHIGGNGVLRTLRVVAFYLMTCVLLTLGWPIFLINVPLMLLFAAASTNTIYSMTWASRIGSAIAHEREQETYDLICLLPVGALGAGWALSTAHLHRSALFRTLRLLMRSLLVALAGALLLVLPVVMSMSSGGSTSIGLFLLLDHGLVLAAAFYCDHIQSLTLAYLIGMNIASTAQNRINAQLWSGGIFLLLQMLIYMMTLIFSLVLIPALLNHLHVDEMSVTICTPMLTLAIFYALHEIAIWFAWRRLAHQFNASPADQDSIFRRLGYD
jgi:hypothetical protein